jgi:hypothetical protein
MCDWGFRDWGLSAFIPNPQSQISNPQSQISEFFAPYWIVNNAVAVELVVHPLKYARTRNVVV